MISKGWLYCFHRGVKAGLMLTVTIAAGLALFFNEAAADDNSRYIDSFRDWSLYEFSIDEGKVCYIASRPTKEQGDYTRRGAAAVLVTRWPIAAPNEQVSVQPGYSYLSYSTVTIDVDGKTFELFTKGEHAWASTTDQDTQIIDEMKKGRGMNVRGTSTKETYSLDTYSLLGFTAAYQAMQDACK